jgi:N-acetylmuramic acid 6-phosphate etherase
MTPHTVPSTETPHEAHGSLDTYSTVRMVEAFVDDQARAVAAVRAATGAIAAAVDLALPRIERGGRLFYVGAGTSGRLGVLDAYECPPTFNVPPTMVQAILAGGDRALMGAFEDAEDDFDGGATAVRSRDVSPRDIVIGIAASGRTPFVWGALTAARALGATTILLCFNPQLAFQPGTRPHLVIAPATGPEVLTGSTRLKAGTATKQVLNILTTLAMVRLGKVVENLMIDVRPTNAKLRQRAIRIVTELAGVSEAAAAAALARHHWDVHQTVRRLA